MKTNADFWKLERTEKWKRCTQEIRFFMKYLVDDKVIFGDRMKRDGQEMITFSFPASMFEWDEKTGLKFKE